MNLTGWRFLLFAVVGAAAIILLAGIGVPSGEEVEVDRHTGERRRRVLTVADAYHESRETGDARLGLKSLEPRLAQFPDNDVLPRLRAVLRTEFEPPPPDHPHAAAIAAEAARAVEARKELHRRIREKFHKESLLPLLIAREADEAQAAAIEEYFAPLTSLRKGRPLEEMGPDERAAHAKTAEDFLAVAEVFRARARMRARLRWLFRAYANAAPGAYDVLYAAYLDQGRLPEAFLVLGAELRQTPKRIELWRERAKLAGWLSLAGAEAEAQEVLLAHNDGDSDETRRRLITLFDYIGEPARSIPHALALTKDATQPDELVWPVRLALQAGLVDRALELLEELAARTGDDAYWRELIITFAHQDMRVERVIKELELLLARHPDRDYEQRIEAVYRRRDMVSELADMLLRRLAREPENRPLETEVLGLLSALGRLDDVRAIIIARVHGNQDPRRFFRDLATYRGLGIPDLAERGRAMANSPGLLEDDMPFVLEELRGFPEPEWQAIAKVVARRFVHRPEARAYLLERVDKLDSDGARSTAAEQLSLDNPKDGGLLKAWIERASWAGDIESELRGRELWFQRDGSDMENRRALADLYGAVNRAADAVVQWRAIAEHDGLESPSMLRLVDALLAAGETEEAMEWLEKRAALPGTTIEDRLTVAEQLFGGGHLDRALRFYMAVLDAQPNHAVALLRTGQIRSWTNDPRGSIPFFTRRLEVTDEAGGEVRFYLGEAYWATQENNTARRLHERALGELTEKTLMQDVMRAKILTRLGRTEEAEPIFDRVLQQEPNNVDLLLDYVDAMIGIRNTRKARLLTGRAKELAPRKGRTMRADGKVAILEGHYEDAAAILTESMRLYGPEAGTESELGRAHELAGEDLLAREAYKRSLTLQPGNRDIEQAVLRMWDKVARIVHANFEYRKVGNETTLRAHAAGSVTLKDGYTRLGAALSFARYEADTQPSQSVGTIEISALRRLTRQNTIAGGIVAYADAPGDIPVGGWVELHLLTSEPSRLFGARLDLNRLLDDPVAAVSLGGRESGLTVFARGDLTRRLWGIFDAKYSSLSIENPDITNGRLDISATLGFRLIEGDTRTGQELDVGRGAMPGLLGPDLQGAPGLTRGPLLSVWITYQMIRLLDSQQLATIIPIGQAFDYVSVGSRIDIHLANALGVTFEGYAGSDLSQSDFFFGVEAIATWRPSPQVELTFSAAYGSAVGRADGAESLVAKILFSYRW